jgi:hypothetical protein
MRPPINYEFDEGANAVFARLAGAMVFDGIAMCIPGVLLGVVAFLWRPTLIAQGICGVLALLLVAMGVLQYRAAGHFRRIVTTQGKDVESLMIALGELTSVYEIQRWLWLVLGAVVLLALAGTVTGYSP